MSSSLERVELALREADLPSFRELRDRDFLFTYRPNEKYDHTSIIGGKILGVHVDGGVMEGHDVIGLTASVPVIIGTRSTTLLNYAGDKWFVNDSNGEEVWGSVEFL